jgi:hypothetical protein
MLRWEEEGETGPEILVVVFVWQALGRALKTGN